MTDNGDDSVTVFAGYFTMGADESDVDAIRDAVQDCGYTVDIDRADGSFTVQHDREQARQELAEKAREAQQGGDDYQPLDTGDDADDAPEEAYAEQDLTKRELRIKRLEEGIEDGKAYTSDELAAIAYEIDVADVSASERAYTNTLRASGDIDLQSMPDQTRAGPAKLYYRGEQPDVEEPDKQDDQEEQDSDTADCQYCGKEYTKRGVRRHERACDENPDVETAWTVTRVETVMHGSGWMTTEEIAQDVLDKKAVSYDERDRFHNLLHRKPDLKARITSRPDPDDQRRNQYRLDDTDAEEDSAESTSECGCPTNEAGEVQHTGDCLGSAEQEIEEMQDLYEDDEPADPDLPEPEPDPDEPVPADIETGDDEDEDNEDSEDNFTCTACGQQFDTFQGLRDHHCETGDFPCPECDTAFDDDEALQNHLRDKHPGFYGGDPITHAGTGEDADEGEDDDEELLEEMGPCNIGKIMVRGDFERYVCQECHKTFHDEADADAHADEYKHLWFKAFDQVPDKPKQSAGFVGGGSAR